jgi:hypothetical protein
VPDRAYIETSIIGYLTTRAPADVVTAARQELTRQWWATQRSRFQLVTSQVVIDEIAGGDPQAAGVRLQVARGIPILDSTAEAELLTRRLLSPGPLPSNAVADAAHIAIATVHGVPFLLTWNCRHIANAVLRPHIERICIGFGLRPPILCTPEELLDVSPPEP